MKKLIIKATFIGHDGSLDYKSGDEYDLLLTHYPGQHSEIVRIDKDEKPIGGEAKYQSVYAFLCNWDKVETQRTL